MSPFRVLAVVLLLLTASCDLASPDAGLATIESSVVGLALRELPRPTLRSLGLPYGLAVVKVEAVAANAGLRLGDVIYGVNHRGFRSAIDFARLVAEQPPGAPLGLLVRRGGTDLYLPLDPARRVRRQPTDTLLRT